MKMGRTTIERIRNPGCNDPNFKLGPTQVTTGGTITAVGSQFTVSEAHPEWKRRKNNSFRQDIGGEFFTQRKYIEGQPASVSIVGRVTPLSTCESSIVKYSGPVWALNPTTVAFPPASNSSDTKLNQLGTTAIAQCKPTNSVANLAVAFGEFLRPRGIPEAQVRTWRARTEKAKAAGSDYLNVQFGWAPLVDEVFNFAHGVLDADQLLDQYERDAGKVVRRRFEFPTEKSDTTSVEVTGSPNQLFYLPYNTRLMNQNLSQSDAAKLYRTRTTSKRAWFSGAFTYYLPRGYDSRNEVHRKALFAKQVLGIDPSPDTLWNLAPWSWAVDWFSNAGDVISNVSDFVVDGLVMPYGYMMEHTLVKDTYSRKFAHQFHDGQSAHSTMSLVTETKIRRKATPYGFGLSWDGLSTFQTSILLALGLSRR